MTLEQFCKRAGCVVIPCEPGWGGRFAYMPKDKQYGVYGFRTEQAAYRAFIRDNCGPLANQVLALIRASEKKEPA